MIEKTKEDMINFIRAMMSYWEISIHDIFDTENNKKRIIIMEGV